MDIRYALSLFQALRGDRFAFGYSGSFHDDHTARLIVLGESVMNESGSSGSARSRLAFVMVEAYQNIIRHRVELTPELAAGAARSLFVLRCQEAGQHVVAVNPVSHTTAPRLREVLKRLDGLGKDQLKEMFLSRLQEGDSGSTRGAGLGLIEMTRRSGDRLGHAWHDVGNDLELFALAVKLGEGPDYPTILKSSAALHGLVVQEDVRVFHVGPRTAAIEEAVLRLIEKDEDNMNEASACSRGYLAAMELLAHYVGGRRTGVLMLCGSGDRRGITVGAPVDTGTAQRFQNDLAEIGTWDRMKLERHYRDHLLKRDAGSVPFGLIELVRLTTEPVEQLVVPYEDGSFVSFRVML
ncbi:MAG TPA: SiaB family protein kinase [Flavobacteriales bacterium]|nr:SiaB family protein kinase [Flavobacteriales bacterium]